jgi:Domain of unknown function (DUF4331)
MFETMKGSTMSHHFDSPAALADGRINPCDLYVFPATPSASALILTVNPDAGRSSPTTFRPDALYELVVASDGGTGEDLAFQVAFGEPDEHGRQQVQIRRANGPAARYGTKGVLLGEGRSGEVFSLDGDGLAWAGLAADPFTGDGVALGGFLQALGEGRYRPEVFTAAPANTFAGRDVTAIALQVPDAVFGGSRVAVWGRISLYGHGPQRQVSRIGQPMLRPLFFNPPDTDVDALNADAPANDRARYGGRVRRPAATVARLAGLPDPDGHAEAVMLAFLPDVLGYRPGQPAAFHPGDGNGRALGDNAFDIAVAGLAGSPIAATSAPPQATPTFPYLSPSQPATLPALVDLYFRQSQQAG